MMGPTSPPASGTDAMKTLGDLLGVVSDPGAYQERLTSLREAEAAAKAANETLAATRAEVAAAQRNLDADRAKLESDKAAFTRYQAAQTDGLNQRETALNQTSDNIAERRKKLEADTVAANKALDDRQKELDGKAKKLATDIEAHRIAVAQDAKEIQKARATADLLAAHSAELREKHDAVKVAQAEVARTHTDLRTSLDKILAVQK